VVVVADTLYFSDIRLEGIIANSLVAPFQQGMFWRDYSRIYEIEVYAPDVQIQCMYIGLLVIIIIMIIMSVSLQRFNSVLLHDTLTFFAFNPRVKKIK